MTFFTYDDDEIEPDTRDVLAASAELEITEFRLFELAYCRWFGEPLNETKMEQVYSGYMFQARAPYWVRHFCRDVLTHARNGDLDPRSFGVFPTPESDSMFNRGVRYSFLVFFVITTFHLIAVLVSNY
ncbi:MAG: hypothetical protein R3174_02700 [Gammaproteobacteria bacterium]|nr:hypothetical protein [Gammaproteobacteria bacterium]